MNDTCVVNIREYRKADSCSIAEVFHLAIENIDSKYYSLEQRKAWSPELRYEFWQSRIVKTKPYVAEADGRVIGFIELKADGHIDCFYVHPEYQRKGVAQALFNYASAAARSLGLGDLSVEASKLARPFFEKQGFTLVRENTVVIRDVALINYSMRGRPAES